MKKIYHVVLLILVMHVAYGQEFTFGTIPDTQNLTENDGDAGRIMDITGWYVGQRANLNLKFVASLGDMTQWGDHGQWQRVRNAYDLFKNDGLPYAPCQGNHDPQLDRFNQYFPESEFIGTPTYGGNFRGMENAYYLFSEAGMDFIIVVIQSHDNYIGHYDQASIDWANDILTQYSNRRAIFVTHDFFEERGLINDVIKKHDNLFLAVCGHSCAHHGEYRWTETSPGGNTVNCIMSDYQCRQNNKAAILRYYTFKPNENKIYAYSYDVVNNNYLTASTSQFTIDYDMTNAPCETPHEAYQGNTSPIPGVIEAEHYNQGCPGVPYFDTSPSNEGGEYRNDAVDIEVCSEGGFNVGWTEAGEWLNYEVNVASSGNYSFEFRVASMNGGGTMHLEVDNTDISGPINIGATDGWQNWTNVAINGITLNNGVQHLKVVVDEGGFNLNKITTSLEGSSNQRTLVWADEFNYSGLPDPSKWGYDTGNGGFGNNELQNYTANRLENARVENGSLIIEARRDWYQDIEYSSARLVTRNKGDWLNGRVEVRAKLPGGRGAWSAIWMLPTDWEYGGWPDSGEIDIMENVGYDPNWVHGTVHTGAYNHLLGTQLMGSIMREDYQSQFHTYAIEWEENKIDFILDDEIYHSFSRHGSSPEWPFDKRFHLILNIAVGGNWGGALGVDPNVWPQRMEVDYVRVYEKAFGNLTAAIPGKVEAEHYYEAKGVRNEECSEGGLDVGYMDVGDYMIYDVEVAEAGQYLVEYRVASDVGGGVINLEQQNGAVQLGSATIPNTGGWQTWQTVSHTVQLNAGSQKIGIGIGEGGFNLNHLTFTLEETPPTVIHIEAEDFVMEDGIDTENCVEGGQNIGWTHAGDWVVYDAIIPAGTYELSYRVASEPGGGQIRIEKAGGSQSYGLIDVNATGGWQDWTTISQVVTIPEALDQIALKFESGGVNVNWFKFASLPSARVTSVDELHGSINQPQISLFPNPVRSILKITGLSGSISGLQIIGMDGKRYPLRMSSQDDQSFNLDLSQLKEGLYFIHFVDNTGLSQRLKIVKQ